MNGPQDGQPDQSYDTLLSELAKVPDTRRVDPYLQWALLTRFSGFGGPKAPDAWIAFLLELESVDAVGKLAEQETADGRKLAEVPLAYYRLLPTRFCTARVLLKDVKELLCLEYVRRAQMGVPAVEPVPGFARTLIPPFTVLDIVGPRWKDETPVIGLIDHGIGFLHQRIRVDTTLRIVHPPDPPGRRSSIPVRFNRMVRFWDQWSGSTNGSRPLEGPWQSTPDFAYGRLLEAAALTERAFAPTGDAAKYRALDYAPVLSRASHGTHVMDLAAGAPDPLAGRGAAPDAAGLLPVIGVQLPWRPEKDPAGASLCVQVMDALRFIVASARFDNNSLKRGVVVNLSDGALAGSHTGSSVLERAMDALLSQHPSLSLVVAAGNAYRAKAHAHGRLGPTEAADLEWRVLPDDRTENFVQIWTDEDADLEVSLVLPSGGTALTVAPGKRIATWSAAGEPEVLAAGIFAGRSPHGNGRLVLLALRPTKPRRPGAGRVPHGTWRLRIANKETSRRVAFDAWIERDDPPFPDPGPRRQSTFVGARGARITGANTLNSIATGEKTIVVGGYRRSDDALARYTSAGSPRAISKKPTVVAPSDESASLPGLRAAGSFSGTTIRMNGTSVAAPVVTRLVANLLATHATQQPPRPPPDADEIREALREAVDMVDPPYTPDEASAEAHEHLRTGYGWVRPGAVLRMRLWRHGRVGASRRAGRRRRLSSMVRPGA